MRSMNSASSGFYWGNMKTEVKKVLDHFGLDENDYERLSSCVDWESLAKSIENPTKVAVCNVLDGNGEIVMSNGKPTRVFEEVQVENAQEELKKKSLLFVEWWD